MPGRVSLRMVSKHLTIAYHIMSATVYGEVNFGMAEEAGIYAASVDFDIKAQEKWIMDSNGDDVAGALYNESATFSLSGVRRTGQALVAKVAASVVLANAVDFSLYIEGYQSGGLTYLMGIKPSLKNDDFETLDLTGGFKPWVVQSAGA